MSATARKRKEELAQALRKLIQSKGKTPALKYQQLFDDLRAQSDTVSFLPCFYSFINFKSMCFFKISIILFSNHIMEGKGDTIFFN